MAEVNVNPVRKIFVVLVVFSVGHAVCGEVIKSGTDYTFKSSITGKPQTILWKYQGNKLVEFENNDLQYYRFKGRAELNTETGDLTLPKLNKDDSGRYESEIQVAGVIQSSKHDIEVFDALPKPSVTCEVNGTEAKLNCSVDSSAKFKWNGPKVEGREGHTITVPKVPKESDEAIYICIVTNEVGSNSTEFSLKNCFKEENSGDNTVTIVIVVVIILLIVLIVGGYILWKHKFQGVCFGRKEDVEMQTDQKETEVPLITTGQPNGAEPPDNTEHKHGSDGQSPENNLASTQTVLEETPSKEVGDPLGETVEKGTDGGAEEPTQTVEGPPLKDKDGPTKPPGETMDQGTDRGEDPPGDPEDGSDRGNDEGNPTSTLTDLEETKALEKKDSISNHGDAQKQAASQPVVISNHFANETPSASGIEEKIEMLENLAGKPKEISSSGIVEKKIEEFEQFAWKPKEISSRPANQDSG